MTDLVPGALVRYRDADGRGHHAIVTVASSRPTLVYFDPRRAELVTVSLAPRAPGPAASGWSPPNCYPDPDWVPRP